LSAALKVIDDICVGSRTLNRESLLKFEEFAKEQPQLEIPVKHYIHGGMYGREITIPKDTILTGQIYKFNHFDVMISGDITVSTDNGETKRFTGYNCFMGMAGKKRAGYAHEDTTWITFHPYTGKSGDDIQKFITAETFEELELFNVVINRADYLTFVNSIGMNQAQIDEQVNNKDDLSNLDIDCVYVADSKIEGKGLFSYRNFEAGDTVCLARENGKRTIAGRYTNHAIQPNAEIAFIDGEWQLRALAPVFVGEEFTISYRDVLNNRLIKGDLCQE